MPYPKVEPCELRISFSLSGKLLDQLTITPVGGQTLVRPYELPDRSDGGIWFPDAFRADVSGLLWEVVAVSRPWRRRPKAAPAPSELSAGDIVHADARFVAQSITLDRTSEPLYFVHEDNISGVYTWDS